MELKRLFLHCAAALMCLLCLGKAQNAPDFNQTSSFVILSNKVYPLTLIQDVRTEIEFTLLINNTGGISDEFTHGNAWTVSIYIDRSIVKIRGKSEFVLNLNHTSQFVTTVIGSYPGRAELVLELSGSDGAVISQYRYSLLVEREDRPIDIAFNVVIILLVILANIGMGCKVDLDVVKKELKKPVAPIIGLCSQFIFMPLISFALAYNLDLDPGIALGFFALGCSPGGSASNAYTHLLNGNVSLSVTMTLVSTLAALGLLPMWLFSLGRLLFEKTEIKIPFPNMLVSLVGILVPVIIGLVLQRKLPKVATLAIRAVKYIMVIFLVFVLTVGIYANVYIFYLVNIEVIIAAMLLPYLGFVFGGGIALILRQNMANVAAIAVETGIQNTGIPILLLRMSLSGPEKDTGIVVPVVSALFTPLPLIVAILYVQFKKWRHKRDESVLATEREMVETEVDVTTSSSATTDQVVAGDALLRDNEKL